METLNWREHLWTWCERYLPRFRFRRGLTHIRQGQYRQAIAEFDRALAHDPNLAEVYLNRGLACSHLGKVQEAIADYSHAIWIDPDLAPAYCNRALACYGLGDEQSALADWEQALRISPDYAEAYFNRGLVYAKQQKLPQALADFDQALRINPDLAAAYNSRGIVRYLSGDKVGALADWEQALRTDLSHAEAFHNLQRVRQELQTSQLQTNLQIVLDDFFVSVEVSYGRRLLTITLSKPRAVEVPYPALAELVQRQLARAASTHPLKKVRLIGKPLASSWPEWQAVYNIHERQPRPMAYWGISALIALLVFPPIGIAALLYARRVDQLHQQGDSAGALRASRIAQALCVCGASLGVLTYGLVLTLAATLSLNPEALCQDSRQTQANQGLLAGLCPEPTEPGQSPVDSRSLRRGLPTRSSP